MQGRRKPMLLMPGSPLRFPDPSLADDDGLLAIGGDLSVERLLLAYRSGIFPWYDRGLPPLWWSPNPRAVLEPHAVHVSRSMRRTLRKSGFSLTANRAFESVMRACGAVRSEGTWILPEMIDAYVELHRRGHAHSIEVWLDRELVGGLYGVQCGGLFAAESMFHTATNASKLALIVGAELLFSAGIRLFDVQFVTPHLASLGVETISRRRYLERLGGAVAERVALR
jgi:leucyl/phenylalanyl-tRNA--protein transferase